MASRLPKGYVAREDGWLAKIVLNKEGEVKQKQICKPMPVITEVKQDSKTDKVSYTVSFVRKGKTVSVPVSGKDLFDGRNIYNVLSEYGLEMVSSNGKDLVEYFSKYMEANDVVEKKLYTRIGYSDSQNELNFIHPVLIEEGAVIEAKSAGYKDWLDLIEVKGTLAEWNEKVFDKVKCYDDMVFGIAVACLSPFVKIAGTENFILDYAGKTSIGKSQAQRVIMSVIGKPYHRPWYMSNDFFTKINAFMNGFPVILDDTKKLKSTFNMETAVYTFCDGRTDGKGTVDAIQASEEFRGVIISSGEFPIEELANAGGVGARIIEIVGGDMWGGKVKGDVLEACEECYGVVMLEIAKLIGEMNKNPKAIKIFKAKSKEYSREYEAKCGGLEILQRMARTYGALKAGCELLSAVGIIPLDGKVIDRKYEQLKDYGTNLDKTTAELVRIIEYLQSNRATVWSDDYIGASGFAPSKVNAIVTKGKIYLTVNFINQMLAEQKQIIRNDALNRGYFEAFYRKDKKTDYKNIKHEGKTFTVVQLTDKFIQEYDIQL